MALYSDRSTRGIYEAENSQNRYQAKEQLKKHKYYNNVSLINEKQKIENQYGIQLPFNYEIEYDKTTNLLVFDTTL